MTRKHRYAATLEIIDHFPITDSSIDYFNCSVIQQKLILFASVAQAYSPLPRTTSDYPVPQPLHIQCR